MDAVNNILINIGVVPLQTVELGLVFLPLGAASSIIADGAVLCAEANARWALFSSDVCYSYRYHKNKFHNVGHSYLLQ